MWDVRVVPAVKVVPVQMVEVLVAKVALVQTVEARKASVRDVRHLSKGDRIPEIDAGQFAVIFSSKRNDSGELRSLFMHQRRKLAQHHRR